MGTISFLSFVLLVVVAHDKGITMTFALPSSAWPTPVAIPNNDAWSFFGNHRYVITVPASTPINATIAATVPWRRKDSTPLQKDVFIVTSPTSSTAFVSHCNVNVNTSDATTLTISFSADIGGKGPYYLYYMPFTTCEYNGGGCQYNAMAWYSSPSSHCFPNGNVFIDAKTVVTPVSVVYEAVRSFDAFTDMERPMSVSEQSKFSQQNVRPDSLLLITEYGTESLRSFASNQIPYKYLSRNPSTFQSISLNMQKNENTSFQVIVLSSALSTVTYGTVTNIQPVIPGVTITLLNADIVDYWGRSQQRSAPIQPNALIPLWFAVQVSNDAPSISTPRNISVQLTFRSNFTTSSGGVDDAWSQVTTIVISLQIQAAARPPNTDAFPRAHWVNSRVAMPGDNTVPMPYTPITVKTHTDQTIEFSMLGKDVTIGQYGLPTRIVTFGPSASPAKDATPTDVLGPNAVQLNLQWDGLPITWSYWTPLQLQSIDQFNYMWTTVGTGSAPVIGETIMCTVQGTIDGTGYLNYSIAANSSMANSNSFSLSVDVQSNPANTVYGMGLGKYGGLFSKLFPAGQDTVSWSWDGVNGNNGAWMGSTTGGFLMKPKGPNDLWYAAVPYDSKQAPPPPPQWYNNGNGGITLFKRNTTIRAFTGPLASRNIDVAFILLITPVRNLDLPRAFSLRYAQLDSAANYTFLAEHGATVVNIHQGNEINPWINYPYLTNSIMKETSSAVQQNGMKFSIYNTMRELSNRCEETFLLRALNETYVPGNGPGSDWIQEHVQTDYLPAWSTPIHGTVMDAAMRVVAMSRWNNYYAQGIQQMVNDFNLDGIYLDEIAYDRITLMRAKKGLSGRDGVIDHHSDSGAFCVSPAMAYMEHYPFIDRLWYGEGFNYNAATPDYWLVEISGLAFGMTSDMLRYSGMTPFHHRGMLYASSNRWQSGQTPDTIHTDPFVPVSLWKYWKEVAIEESEFHGFWLEYEVGMSAVATYVSDPNLLAEVKTTSYIFTTNRTSRAVIGVVVVASFASQEVGGVQLVFNTTTWGIMDGKGSGGGDVVGNPAYCLSAPVLPPFQLQGMNTSLSGTFTIPVNSGWIFSVIVC